MSKLKVLTSVALATALLSCLLVPAPAHAQNEGAVLDHAIKLFNDGEYLAAQERLVGIDRSKLSGEQQKVRDDYLNHVQNALNMSEKALREFDDAHTAIEEGEGDQAARLLESVLANEFTPEALRRSAVATLDELRSHGVVPAGGAPPAAAQQAGQPPKGNGSTPEDARRARVLTEEADEMVRGGRYDEAHRLYGEALQLVPGYPEAVAGLYTLREHERNIAGAREQTLIDRIRRENQINWQRTVAEYRDIETAIREHVAAERFDEAQQLMIRARQVVESGRQFADPVAKYESLRDEVQAFATLVDSRERAYHEQKVAEVRREIERQRLQHLQEVEQRRSAQVDALMTQAQQHRKDGNLDAAINVLQQVIVIDPTHKPARWMMDALEDLREYKYGRDLREEYYSESRKALNDVEHSKIPWHQQLRYPKNWSEIISRPERNLPGSSQRNSLLFGALNQPIPVDFVNDPFDQVIEQLVDAHRVNIIVNWHDLKRAGVDRNVPIDLSLPQEITLKKALTEVLEQAGRSLVDLGFDVADGAIKIATQDTLDRNTYTAVYDINDLLMEIPIFKDAPKMDLAQVNERTKADRAPPVNPWATSGTDDDDEPEEDPARQGRVRKIMDLIQDTVAPGSWLDRGGSIGSIKEINGQLVITQNTSSQQAIGNLLGKLREQRAVQIAVEARFVTVSSHYLEELGIDLDIVLNSGNAGYDYIPTGQGALTDPVLGNALLLPRALSRLGFFPNAPNLGSNLVGAPNQLNQPFGQAVLIPQQGGGSGRSGTPVPIINQVTSFTSPSNLGSDIPGSFAGQTIGPALSIFGSFLDNIQVDFLIRATQADSRTSVLTAPRLVLFNGQRSWVAVTIQQNFVSQLTPVVATNAVAQAPQTNVIDSGAVLDVMATVTADRRYVTMTLRPGVTRLLDLQTIPFSGGGAGGGFGGGAALAAFIQLPTLSSQRAQTTVSVPDGGTLLIGGQKLATETEIEAGVPILSKIPILRRAYQSRSMIKDEQTLLILVKPKILIQSEQEELAFPTFGRG